MPEWENVAQYDHPYVGKQFTYLPGLKTMKGEPRERDLVIRAGDQVEVESVFFNWNGIERLDMLWVRNLSSTNDIHYTHIEPGELGIPSLSIAARFDLFDERIPS